MFTYLIIIHSLLDHILINIMSIIMIIIIFIEMAKLNGKLNLDGQQLNSTD